MTFETRRLTLRDLISQALLAPLYFLLAGVASSLPILILAALMFLLTIWIDGRPITWAEPDPPFAITFIGVFIAIALGSIPLIIRDYLKDKGLKRIWVPTDGFEQKAEQYIVMFLDKKFESLSRCLKSKDKTKEFVCLLEKMHDFLKSEFALPCSIESIQEQKLDAENPTEDYEYDCVVTANLLPANQGRLSIEMAMDSRCQLKLVRFQFLHDSY